MAFPPLLMLGLYRPGSVARASFALPRGHHEEVRLTVGEINSPLTPGEVVYLWIILSPEEASRIYSISVFGKRLSRKSDNVLVFPFAFHIAVQQPFKTLWSCLLLYELEPSQASFALCFKTLLMMMLLASVLMSLFV